jgi:sirohydrochlorin cobaltochelatase
MANETKGIVLVGHGGIPKDYPGDLVTKLKRLEAQRRASGSPMSAEELELDTKIRTWPRTSETDPYQAGLEALASHMRPLLSGSLFGLAYNEFCGPTLQEAVENIIKQGGQSITVVSTMFTPGGSHSEYEIPEELEELRRKHPGVTLKYAWPYDLSQISKMLMEHIDRFSS